MSDAEFGFVRFLGGPWDRKTERIKMPFPAHLTVPILSGRERTWGRDETVLEGAASYELRQTRGGPAYVLRTESR